MIVVTEPTFFEAAAASRRQAGGGVGLPIVLVFPRAVGYDGRAMKFFPFNFRPSPSLFAGVVLGIFLGAFLKVWLQHS